MRHNCRYDKSVPGHTPVEPYTTFMPRFTRHSRLLNRIFFTLVIAAGLFGWFYVSGNWQPDPSTFEVGSLTGDADIIDLIAGIVEDAIQIFQEITG